jgi:4-hydroxybutyrate dehydrogenase
MGEPSDEMAEAIYKDMPKDVKRIIGIGGGTVMDLCKLFILKQVSPVLDLFDGKIPVEKEKELILIPTTCGTGSEVTNVSVMALVSRNTKKGIADNALYADKAVLISQLLKTLPFKVFATSSIDALVHAVESALSPDSSASFRVFSYNAIELILKGLLADPRPRSGSAHPAYEGFPPGQQLGRHRFQCPWLRRCPCHELSSGGKVSCTSW